MKSFLQFQKNAEEQLGRQLYENEIEFLQLVHERYKQEHQQVNC